MDPDSDYGQDDAFDANEVYVWCGICFALGFLVAYLIFNPPGA